MLSTYILSITISDLAGTLNDNNYVKLLQKGEYSPDKETRKWNDATLSVTMFILFLQNLISSAVIIGYNVWFLSVFPWSETSLYLTNFGILGAQLGLQILIAIVWMLPMIT